MSSSPVTDAPPAASPSERPWSLTRRMTVLFAVTTSLILALHALWSSYFVFDALRDDVRQFMERELTRLRFAIERGEDHGEEAIRECVENVARVSEEPPCAFRVRTNDGELIAEAGTKRLRKQINEPLPEDASWRALYFLRRVAFDSLALEDPPVQLEILVDTKEARAEVGEYVWLALLSFLGSIALAALAGWFTAHRGLQGLRDVVSQTEEIASAASLSTIRVDDAPREVREVGAALNDMLVRIHGGMEEMRTFTAGLAHELRSPLQNLIGETEVTLLAERAPDEYRTLLKSHLDDLHDLSDAVDNLVQYCRRSDPDRRELRTEFFDLGNEVELRLKGLLRAAERADVAIDVVTKGDCGVFADREGCLRVVKNLVGNAIASSPPSTTVRVTIDGEDDTEVRILVDDEGTGVPDAIRDRIFDPFVSGPPKDGHRAGYGLGLTICRSIMDEHHGTITFDARAEGGTRFKAALPRRRH